MKVDQFQQRSNKMPSWIRPKVTRKVQPRQRKVGKHKSLSTCIQTNFFFQMSVKKTLYRLLEKDNDKITCRSGSVNVNNMSRILAMHEAQDTPLLYILFNISVNNNVPSFKNLKTNFLTKGPYM